MKKRWITIAIVLIAVSAEPAWAWSGKVTYITDGDTLWVQPSQGGKPVKIRVNGIDAPEICQAGGQAARAALARRVAGQTVTLSTRRHDDYGRTRGYYPPGRRRYRRLDGQPGSGMVLPLWS